MANLYRNPTFDGLTDWLRVSQPSTGPKEPGQTHDWKEPVATAANGQAIIQLGFGPFWTAFYQSVSALVVGATYRISWRVESDMQHPDVNPQPAGDPLSAETRIKTGNAAGAWFTVINAERKADLSATFVATATVDSLGVEVRARHSLWRNRFALSLPTLELVSLPPPGAGDAPGNPPNPPAPDRLATLTNLITSLTLRVNLTRSIMAGLQADVDAVQDEIVRLRSVNS